MENFNSPAYRKSRTAYTAQCAFEYFITIMMADVYLSSLLTHLGISDGMIGVISSFISLAFLFQLSSIFVVQRIRNVKAFAVTFSTLCQLMFMCVYLIPFMPIAQKFNVTLVTVFILLGYFSNYFCNSIIFKWANSYVDPNRRGNYSAVKEIISLIGGIVFTLFVGFRIDKYKADNDMEGGFAFIAFTIFVLAVLNFICLMLIKNRRNEEKETEKIPLKEVLRNIFGNRSFRNVIIMCSLIYIARYMTVGFLGTYKTKELLFTVGTIQIFNTAANLCRMAITKPFGRFSDKYSYAKGIKLGLSLAALGYLFGVFTAPESRWCILFFTVLYNCSQAGIVQNSMNITYSYLDDKYFVQAMAIKNSIGGVLGFLSSVAAGALLRTVQKNGNTLFGIHIYGQQVLAFISFVITIGVFLFIHFVIEKQKAVKR